MKNQEGSAEDKSFNREVSAIRVQGKMLLKLLKIIIMFMAHHQNLLLIGDGIKKLLEMIEDLIKLLLIATTKIT